MIKKLSFGLAVVGLVSCLSMPSYAQYNEGANSSAQNRIDRLEREIQTLSRAVYRGEKPPAAQAAPHAPVSSNTLAPSAAANLQVKISELEGQVQYLTGKVEELQYQIDRMRESAPVTSGEVAPPRNIPNTPTTTGQQPTAQAWESEPAPVAPETAQSPQTTATTTASNAPKPRVDLDGLSADELYERSFVDIRDGKYEVAETGFATFLKRFPEHRLAANAQYWLAETYYVRGEYTEAAKLFARGYQDFPEGSKVADNLLKLGLSLSRLGKTDDACLTFTQLKSQFSDESGPILRRAEDEASRIGCKS